MISTALGIYGALWLRSLGIGLSRYAVFSVAVWLLLWVVLGRVLRFRKVRPTQPPRRQLLIEFVISLRTVAIFSTVGLALLVLQHTGHLPGIALAKQWGWPWALVSLVAMIVAHDAYFYWTHRAMHDRRLIGVFHRRHHRSGNPSPFSAYSFDVAEAVVQAGFLPVWMVVVPTTWPIVELFMLHQIVRNTLGHSGYELLPCRSNGRPLLDFLTSTTHHDLHHSEPRWNYGLYFTWWDRLMGTEHPHYYAHFAASVGRGEKPAMRVARAEQAVVGGAPASGKVRSVSS